jgi:flagellar biosynthetic protein FlhB
LADSRKTEQPTQKKLREAREKGEIPRSVEVNSTAVMVGFFIVTLVATWPMLKRITTVFNNCFEAAGNGVPLTEDAIFALMRNAGFELIAALLPFFAVIGVVALLSGGLQSGFSFSGKAISFNLNRLNPLAGISRLFSARSWVELFKALFKVSVIFIILYSIFDAEKGKLLLLSGANLGEVMIYTGHLITEVLKKTLIFLAAIAAIDFFWQRHDYMANMKMTKEEVKEEQKQTEGDIRTKSMIRAWHKKKLSHRMMDSVKNATFVTVNPTHYATAIRYVRGMKAPKLLAKGADHMAKRIRLEAEKRGIPVIYNPELTRSIYFSTEVGRYIPPKLFKAVAKVLVFIYKMERERKNGN